MAARASGCNSFRTHPWAELDHRNKTVSPCAVPLLGSRIRVRSECGERSPCRRGEAHRNARLCITKLLFDIAGEALESIDIAPRRLPGAEIGGEFIGCCGQRFQQLFGRRAAGDVSLNRYACLSRLRAHMSLDFLAPKNRQR